MPKISGRTHSFSTYFPPEERFHLQLAEILIKRYHIKSVGELMRILLTKALQDNDMLDRHGNSLIQSVKTPNENKGRKKLMKRIDLRLKRTK